METKATEKYKKKLFTKEKPAKGNVGGFLRSVSRLRFRAYSLTGNILFLEENDESERKSDYQHTALLS